MVKVYPSLKDRILFIGFLQASNQSSCDGFEPVKNEYEFMDNHTIICDSHGFIANVTEGLNFELGLNQKLFTFNSNEMSTSNIAIENICPEIANPDARELLEIEGMTVTINTTELLNLVELEKLSSEELLDIRSKLGTY